MRGEDGPLAWAALDFLSALLLVVYTLIAPTQITKPRVETLGLYAITATWPGSSLDDVDLYVRDPEGHIVFFLSKEAGGLHLENDDIPSVSGYSKGSENGERVVLRQTEDGEYTVNVHMYHRRSPGYRTPVTVSLWRLRGADRRIAHTKIFLRQTGDERTAFRFSVSGLTVTGLNHLQRQLVGRASGR